MKKTYKGEGVNGIKPTRTRAFIKIQDGCNRFCSYCIVPHVRGSLKSRSKSEILMEAQALIQNGVLEIVLTGIQAASYGDDTGEPSFAALIKEISALEGLKRLRLSSIDPWAVNDYFLSAIADSTVLCSHFHLSLQSGSDTTLAKMNRRYTTAEYAKTTAALRSLRPDAAITTDIIVGFPGESDECFNESLAFAAYIKFARVHVFEYSRRIGTPAAGFPGQIPFETKKARSKVMRNLAINLQTDFLKSQIGKTLPVLFETETKPGHYQGHSGNYCRVETTWETSLVNTIRTVQITALSEQSLTGLII